MTTHPRERPQVVKGATHRVKTPCGTLYATINEDDIGPCEIFLRMGKQGSCTATQLESTGRLISLALRLGGTLEDVAKELCHLQCTDTSYDEGAKITSCGDAVATVINRYLEHKEKG